MIDQPGYLSAHMHQQRRDAETAARQKRIKTAWQYYDGEHPPQLRVQRGQADDNTVINLARQVVDKGVSLLFGGEVAWQFDESDGSESEAEAFVNAAWDANHKMAFLAGLGLNGALAGIAALKVVVKPSGAIRFINLDPSYLDIATDEEDIEDVWRYRIEYTTSRHGAEVIRRQDIIKQDATWLIEDFEAINVGPFKQWRSIARSTWPYELAPIVYCQNLIHPNAVWGYTDLEDVHLNDAINGSVSSTRKIVRLHSSPQTIGKGVQVDKLLRGADQFWGIGKDEDVYNLEMQSDLASARQFYVDLRAAFYAQGRMPDMSQVGDLGALTNFGLRVLFADALERTSLKRLTYGKLISDLNNVIALIGGYGLQTTKITWPDPLPINQDEQARTVETKQRTGLVSDETLTTELGYDYGDEQARISEQPDDVIADQTGIADPATFSDQLSEDRRSPVERA